MSETPPTVRFYRIRDWDKHFENNRTRELKHLAWVPLPNKQDGDGYTELLDHPDGAAHFGAWVACVQVASRCDVRGTLLRDGARPHTAGTLSRMTRISEKVLREAIDRLLSIGWIEVCTMSQEGAAIPQEGAALQNRTELNGTEGFHRERDAGGREGDVTPSWTLEHCIASGEKPTVAVPKSIVTAYYDQRVRKGWVDGAGHKCAETQTALEADMRHFAVHTYPSMRAELAEKQARAERSGAKPKRKSLIPGAPE